MARLIDADDVAENLMNSNWFDCDDIDVALQAVKLTDTIDSESLRPHGRWKDACFYQDCPLCYECSNCGLKLMYKPNYCPNCGCFMENKRMKAKAKMEDYGGKNR